MRAGAGYKTSFKEVNETGHVARAGYGHWARTRMAMDICDFGNNKQILVLIII